MLRISGWLQKWRTFLPTYISSYSLPIIHAIQWGANGRKQNEKGRRKKGNEGERRHNIKAAPQSAKISPKGRKTSRVRESRECGITQSGRERTRTNLHITANNAASDACDRHQRHPISPTLCMHRIRLKSHFISTFDYSASTNKVTFSFVYQMKCFARLVPKHGGDGTFASYHVRAVFSIHRQLSLHSRQYDAAMIPLSALLRCLLCWQWRRGRIGRRFLTLPSCRQLF